MPELQYSKQKITGIIIDEVNKYIREARWNDLNQRLATLNLDKLEPVEMMAWFRASFPVRSKLIDYIDSVKRMQQALGLDKLHMTKGLLL